MLLRLVFILSVLFPSFAVAVHVDDEPRFLSCYERLTSFIKRTKPATPEFEDVKWVSRPYKLAIMQVLMKESGYAAATQYVFSEILRDGTWIVESPSGLEERVTVRSVAQNKTFLPQQYSSVSIITQNEPMAAQFYEYAGITSYIEMVNIKDVSETGFTIENSHHYMPGGRTSLRFIFNEEGYLDSLEFGVHLDRSGTFKMLVKVKQYLKYPNSVMDSTIDIRRMK